MTLPCRGWGQGLGFLTAFQPHKRHLHDRSHGVSSQIGNAGGSRRLHGVSLGMAPGREVLSPRENSVRPRRTSETPDALLGSLPCLWASRRPGILKRSYVCYSLVAVSVSSTDFFFSFHFDFTKSVGFHPVWRVPECLGKNFFLFLSPPARISIVCSRIVWGIFLRVLVGSFDSVDNECLLRLVCVYTVSFCLPVLSNPSTKQFRTRR